VAKAWPAVNGPPLTSTDTVCLEPSHIVFIKPNPSAFGPTAAGSDRGGSPAQRERSYCPPWTADARR
jgi:hypothetical protein